VLVMTKLEKKVTGNSRASRFRTRYRPLSRREFLELGGASALAGILGCADSDVEEPSKDASEWQEVPEADNLPHISPITSNDEHYVVSYLGMADVDVDSWECEVYAGELLLGSFDYEFLMSLEARDKEHTLQCIESRPTVQRMSNAVWSGLPLVEIFEAADISVPKGDEYAYLRFMCADGYATGLPASAIDEYPLWLVWKMNGEPLPQKHGFPVRVLSPGLYGWKNSKQLMGIHFQGEEYIAPWEPGGEMVPWAWRYEVQGLIVSPAATDIVQRDDTIYLLGKAYAGEDPVTWVGVSADGGSAFGDAELTYSPGAHRWTLFRAEWRPESAGEYLLVVACETASGAKTNPDEYEHSIPFNGGMALLVQVTAQASSSE